LPTNQKELLAVGRVKPYRGNSRTHSCKQIKQIAQSIERFGFTNPVRFSFSATEAISSA